MYNIYDKKNKNIIVNRHSILEYILNTEYFSNFLQLVFKAQLEKFFNEIEYTNITLFLPIDSGFKNFNIKNINIPRAREIVLSAVLNKRVISELFRTSKYSQYFSKNNKKILITIQDNIKINNNIDIINDNIFLKNGIIHIINKPLIPYLI
tara:strand:- start:377 stop:829 length:453 start_codon:yes stop_codon:yes gene_type:complete